MPCRDHVNRALELSELVLDLADEERDLCDHDGCLLLNAILRDCGLQIRRTATLRRVELANGGTAVSNGRSE